MKKMLLYSVFLMASLVCSSAQAKQALPPSPPGVSSQMQGLFGGAIKPSTKKSNAPLVSTKFKSSGKLLITDTLIGALKLDNMQEKEMRKFIPQVFTAIEQAYIENDLTKNDLSTAVGGLLDICYEMTSGNFTLGEQDPAKKEIEKKKTKAVVRQIQQSLGSNSSFAKIADKDKQSAYEMCTF
jgi:hypothetical protein